MESFGYKILSDEYANGKTKMILECPRGHKWATDLMSFQQGDRCPHCQLVNGRRRIMDVLNELNIEFKTKYTFNDCKTYICLPFDFYLPDYNICIEFIEKQHLGLVNFMGKSKEWAMEKFITQIIRDTIKSEYCKKNDIKLIKILYWDIDYIEEILKEELE